MPADMLSLQPPAFSSIDGAFTENEALWKKPAVVETGAIIKVPLYLEIGEVIKIDTRTREYVERVR